MQLTITNTGSNAVKVTHGNAGAPSGDTDAGAGANNLSEVVIAAGASQDLADLPGSISIKELGLAPGAVDSGGTAGSPND